jgi:hypothetical protein
MRDNKVKNEEHTNQEARIEDLSVEEAKQDEVKGGYIRPETIGTM